MRVTDSITNSKRPFNSHFIRRFNSFSLSFTVISYMSFIVEVKSETKILILLISEAQAAWVVSDRFASADLRDARSPLGPNSFNFMQVFFGVGEGGIGQIIAFRVHLWSCRLSPSGKSWIRHWLSDKDWRQLLTYRSIVCAIGCDRWRHGAGNVPVWRRCVTHHVTGRWRRRRHKRRDGRRVRWRVYVVGAERRRPVRLESSTGSTITSIVRVVRLVPVASLVLLHGFYKRAKHK